MSSAKLNDESPDADFSTSWAATQQQLESCGTHSYIEETGCLQNQRSRASFHAKFDRLTLYSGSTRTHSNSYIHPPAPSLCLHSSETQENPALPLSCTRVSQALDVMSGLDTKTAGMGLTECSSEFEVAWKAADPLQNHDKIYPYAVTGSPLNSTQGQATPHTNQTSFLKAGSPSSENNGLSSSPAILHLPLHCQSQIHGRASWDNNDSRRGSVLSGSSADMAADLKQDSSSPATEERNGVIVIRSTDRAVFSEHTDTRTTTERNWTSPASFCHSTAERQWKFPGVSLNLLGLKSKEEMSSSQVRDGLEKARESSPREKVAPADGRSFVSWISSGVPSFKRKDNADASVKSENPEGQGEEQIIEVDGWCHLPRLPVKSSSTDKALQTCWGLPEAEVRVWGAQILLALESLHQQGILCRDLNPRNVLLTSNGEFFQVPLQYYDTWKTAIILTQRVTVITGKVCLTFFGQWSEVQSEICSKAMEDMYCAPGKTMHAVGRDPSLFLSVTCHLVARFSRSKRRSAVHSVWGYIEMLRLRTAKHTSLRVDRNWWRVQSYRGL